MIVTDNINDLSKTVIVFVIPEVKMESSMLHDDIFEFSKGNMDYWSIF